jgi:hypothetical protein
MWLNSRGKFMFLHCVVLDKQEIAEPWKVRGPTGNLFVFRCAFARQLRVRFR